MPRQTIACRACALHDRLDRPLRPYEHHHWLQVSRHQDTASYDRSSKKNIAGNDDVFLDAICLDISRVGVRIDATAACNVCAHCRRAPCHKTAVHRVVILSYTVLPPFVSFQSKNEGEIGHSEISLVLQIIDVKHTFLLLFPSSKDRRYSGVKV